MSVFDPSTGRRGVFGLTEVQNDPTEFSPTLRSSQPAGTGKLRVRAFDALGAPLVMGKYHVISPKAPFPIEFPEAGPGVFELPVSVPASMGVLVLPLNRLAPPYYEQFAFGSVHVDFDGQTGST